MQIWRKKGEVHICICKSQKPRDNQSPKYPTKYTNRPYTKSLYTIEIKLIFIFKFVNFSKNSLIHAMFCIQNTKQQNLNPFTIDK